MRGYIGSINFSLCVTLFVGAKCVPLRNLNNSFNCIFCLCIRVLSLILTRNMSHDI